MVVMEMLSGMATKLRAKSKGQRAKTGLEKKLKIKKFFTRIA